MESIPAPRAGAARTMAAPVYQEAADPTAGAFGGAAVGAAAFVMLGIFVLICAIVGASPDMIRSLADKGLYMVAGLGIVLAIIFGVAGLIIGKAMS
jgi:hypothetical protein